MGDDDDPHTKRVEEIHAATPKIAEAAGGLPEGGNIAALAADLQEAYDSYSIRQYLRDNPPSPQQRIEFLEQIEKLSRRLAKVLGTEGGKDIEPYVLSALAHGAHVFAENGGAFPDHPPSMTFETEDGLQFTHYGPVAAIRRAARDVWYLYKWAKVVRQEDNGQTEPPWKPGGPSAEAWLVGNELPRLYQHHFGRAFNVSKPWGALGPARGPAIAFSRACLAAFGIDKKPDAIAKMLSRYRSLWDIDPEKNL